MPPTFTSEVNPRIRTLADAFRLQGAEIKTIAGRVDQRFRKNETALFKTEGSSGGRGWPRLSPAYARSKRRKFPGRKILVRTGRLRKSLTLKSDPGHVLLFGSTPRAFVTMGTRVDYGAHHVPRRDPLQHTRQQETGYLDIVRDYLVNVKLRRVNRSLLAWRRMRRR